MRALGQVLVWLRRVALARLVAAASVPETPLGLPVPLELVLLVQQRALPFWVC